MMLDHLIPFNRAKDANNFATLSEEYQLRADFDINAYYNFVPSHPSCNRRKSDGLFPAALMLYVLDIAAKKAVAVQKSVEQHEKGLSRVESGIKLEQILESNVLTETETSFLKQLILSMKKGQRRIADACRTFAQSAKCGRNFSNRAWHAWQ